MSKSLEADYVIELVLKMGCLSLWWKTVRYKGQNKLHNCINVEGSYMQINSGSIVRGSLSRHLLITYLPTIPEFPGQPTKVTSYVSSCLGSIQNCPGNYYVASAYKSDRDRMLASQDRCQPQDGCQLVRSSEPLPKD